MTALPAGPLAGRPPAEAHPDRIGASIRRLLAEAPVGRYALLEAAFAAQRLRPGEPKPAGTARYQPVVQTDGEDVAARVARLLSGLAWAIVTRSSPAELRVEVPRAVYHRVTRALSGAWRDARRRLCAAPELRVDPGVAVALWRMAMLADGIGPQRDMVYLRAGGPALAEVLVAAAQRLGLSPVVEPVRGGPAVALCHPADVRWLLAEAGAADAARLWRFTA